MTEIKNFIRQNNLYPKRSLGQNFLVNPDISRKTAELSLNGLNGGDCGVIEIGPGLGALTGELCKIYKKVAAIEIDKAFAPHLNALAYNNLKIIFADFLKTDLKDLSMQEFAGIKNINICANLPYYITTPVVLKIIRENFQAVTVMVQKEAADKLCAKAGTASYCETSALVSYFGEAEKLFNVPRSDFYPQPNVLSSVVRLIKHKTCGSKPKNEDLFFKIISESFKHRRKTFINAVSPGLKLDRGKLSEIVKKTAGDENIRGEALDIKKFAAIADLIDLI
jgi:16S rRNA (adenine1518-N6/adenine1519-N6)-dimethyltransferase